MHNNPKGNPGKRSFQKHAHKKSLGQNFIENQDLLSALVDAAGVSNSDYVLEIGPGLGTMTNILAQRAKKVLCIELDDSLLPLLSVFLEAHHNLKIMQGDALKIDLQKAMNDLADQSQNINFSVVANIPYYITTPLIMRLLDKNLNINKISIMVQKEVAEKMLAQPGESSYGLLAIYAQYFTMPKIAMEVPASCFTPPPKVDSAFVIMPKREAPICDIMDEACFFRVAKAAFAMRRKTMQNNLQAAFGYNKKEAGDLLLFCGLDPMVRGERLSMQDFACIANSITKKTL